MQRSKNMEAIMECYDLYISMGYMCRTAYYLKMHDLRIESYPLDWMYGYSLDTVIHLFKTKFEDFFAEIEDESSDWDGHCRKVRDTKNNIVSIHHFPWDKEAMQMQKEFLEKMKRRFKSMDDKLSKAKRVVLLSNREDSIDKLQYILKEFSNIYPHLEIKLINIRNNEEMDTDSCDKKTYVVNEKLSIEEYSFNDAYDTYIQEKAVWRGNADAWRGVLKNYYNDNRLEIMQKLKTEKNLVIYGAGESCMHLVYKFELYDIKIKGIAVTDVSKNPKSIIQYDVNVIEKYDKNDKIIISLKDRQIAEMIKDMLLAKGYYNLYLINDYDFWYKDYIYREGF